MRRAITTILILSNLAIGAFLLGVLIKDRKPIFHPFDVNLKVTKESLIKSGYRTMIEDVPLLGKRVGDTLIYYQLREEYIEKSNDVYWRNCEIRINNPDSLDLVNFIRKYDCYIISNWNMANPSFFVRSGKNNMIYDCSLGKDTELKDVMSISLFYPKID